MSTSATIKIEGFNTAIVYKHYDGYPSATLPWLESFNQRFTKERGDDPEYKFAQLLRSSAFDANEFDLDDSRSTGWGVSPMNVFHSFDYSYTLHADGSVTYQNNSN